MKREDKGAGEGRNVVFCLALLFGAAACASVASAAGGNASLKAFSSPVVVAAEDDAPASRDALFGDDDASPKEDAKKEGLKPEAAAPQAGASQGGGGSSGLRGFVQFELARTIDSPVHWSKMLTRADMGAQGSLGNGIKWKLGARLDYDAVYSLYSSDYPPEVIKDQRTNLTLRENYIDFGSGDWEFRLGRQHVVWGEMVGLFFADVVSALDSREFILPEFDIMRIPQWAARAEYFKDDFHAELLWIPVASYDEIGKPGSEFFPGAPPPPAGYAVQYRDEARPSRTLAHTNYGLRLSTLKNGWDMSAFYYNSMAATPTFYREIVAAPQTFVYEARHDRIQQAGGTVAKDLGTMVLKGEAVYTQGRRFNVQRLTETDGVARQNTLDWAVGLDFPLPADTRLNLQLFQRAFFNRDPDLVFYDKYENGYSILLNRKFTSRFEAEALLISSLNRSDWLFRPRMAWSFEKNWKLAVGVDVFKGPPLGMFGRFDNRDRVYSELRHSF